MLRSGTGTTRPQSGLHVLAVETGRARQQPARIDQVRRAARMDVDLEVRIALDERSGGSGMVEVDVGQKQRPGRLGDPLEQRFHAAFGPRIDDRAAQVPCAYHALAPGLEHVDQLGVGQPSHRSNVTHTIRLVA